MNPLLLFMVPSLYIPPSIKELNASAEFVGIVVFSELRDDQVLKGFSLPFRAVDVNVHCIIRQSQVFAAETGKSFSVLLGPQTPEYPDPKPAIEYVAYFRSDGGNYLPIEAEGYGYFEVGKNDWGKHAAFWREQQNDGCFNRSQ